MAGTTDRSQWIQPASGGWSRLPDPDEAGQGDPEYPKWDRNRNRSNRQRVVARDMSSPGHRYIELDQGHVRNEVRQK